MNPNDDMKYQDVVNNLKQMQQVKAPSGFEADLMRRINSGRYPAENSYRRKIFLPYRLIPSAALALTAILLIFVLNNNGTTQDNPLLQAPREREDSATKTKTALVSSERQSVSKDELSTSREISGGQKIADNLRQDKPAGNSAPNKENFSPTVKGNISPAGNSDRFITANFTSNRITDYPVSKAGLNFRQINLSTEQKVQLSRLKERLELMFNERSKQ